MQPAPKLLDPRVDVVIVMVVDIPFVRKRRSGHDELSPSTCLVSCLLLYLLVYERKCISIAGCRAVDSPGEKDLCCEFPRAEAS